ncbi:MAG: methyltransferase domain-containing protein [Methylococcales bacterium]|nr:methyltransferase domain-containing protein [Methylococcales bacterium]
MSNLNIFQILKNKIIDTIKPQINHQTEPSQAEPSRKDLLFSLFDATGLGLEIGPSFNPLVPKADGYNVEILDHLSAANLREKYKGAPNVDLLKIEEVDYISDGGSILNLIGKHRHYDYIIASHVVEHTTDFLGFISDCEQLLNDDGVLVLAVPDKRFAFDCLRSYSTTGQILQAHLEKRQRHTPGQVFDEIAYNCLRDGAIAWKNGDSGSLSFFRPLNDAKAVFEELQQHDKFYDIHAWQFTPSSFRLIMNDLFEIGAIHLRENSFHETIGPEFFISLSKGSIGCSVDRLLLAERTVNEQNAIIVRS